MSEDDWSNWNILTIVKQVFGFYQIVNVKKPLSQIYFIHFKHLASSSESVPKRLLGVIIII